jgi:23S rRNA (guanosine2251-2'-O)-methyltransferase
MPGNSRNVSKRVVSKKGSAAGSGGKNKSSLKGRGKTLPADERPWHKGYSGTEKLPEKTARKQDKERRAAAAEGRAPKIGVPGSKDTTWGRGGRNTGRPVPQRGGRGPVRGGPRVAPGRRSNPTKEGPELLLGRNPVVEALRAAVPATALYVAQGIDIDERVAEAVRTAGDRGIPILEIGRNELDRMTGGVLHQGIGLQVPPFAYEDFDDLVAASLEQTAPLLVALSQVVNLTRAIKTAQKAGFTAIGLDADGETDLYQLEAAIGPLLVVVGSEGRGLSRLVGETCDLRVSIPMASDVESLNASVAAAVTLAEVARRRTYGQ